MTAENLDAATEAPAPRGRGGDRVFVISLLVMFVMLVGIGVAGWLVWQNIPRVGGAPRTALDSAMRKAEAKVEQSPKDPGVRLEYVYVLADFKQLDLALEQCDRAEKLAKKDAGWRAIVDSARGYAYQTSGDLKSAAKMWLRSIDITPTYSAEYSLGLYYRDTKQYDDALKHWEAALKIKPDDGQVRAWVGSLYEKSGDTKKALARYREAAAYLPNDKSIKDAIKRLSASTGSE